MTIEKDVTKLIKQESDVGKRRNEAKKIIDKIGHNPKNGAIGQVDQLYKELDDLIALGTEIDENFSKKDELLDERIEALNGLLGQFG